MGLQLILGGSGYGKSYRMYKTMVELSESNRKGKYLAIVPEQFTMETQRTIVNLSTCHGSMNIDILSFDRLAKRIFEEAGQSILKVLDDTGKCLIIRKIIEENKKELSIFKSKVKMAGFIDEMKSMISELYQYGIGEEELKSIIDKSNDKPLLKAKFKDVSLIVRKLNEYLDGRFVMNEELLSKVCDIIPDSSFVRNSYITFDEYTGFSPVQYKVIGQLLKYSKVVNIALTVREAEKVSVKNISEQDIFALSWKTVNKLKKIAEENGTVIEKDIILNNSYRHAGSKMLGFLENNIFKYGKHEYLFAENDSDKSDVSIHVCNNGENEAIFIASKILQIIKDKNVRFKEIAVLCADVDEYHRVFEDVFSKYDIPYFMDYKRNIVTNPCVEAIRAVLEMISDNYSYESVFRYIRSGMSSLERNEADILENFLLRTGIRGIKKWSVPFNVFKKDKDKLTKEEETEQEIIDGARIKLIGDTFELYSLLKKNKNGIIVKEAVTAIYEFCVKMKFEEKLELFKKMFIQRNDVSKSREYAQVYGRIMELFDKIVYLLGDETIILKELTAILDAGFEDIKVGIVPQALDRVQIGDIERTRLKDIKVLFIAGANDGLIPKSNAKTGILTGQERNFLAENDIELSPTSRENAFIQKYYLYLMMTKMSEKLYISFKRINGDGSGARASYIVGMLTRMIKGIPVIDEEKKDVIMQTDKIFNERTATEYLAARTFEFISDNLSQEEKIVYRDIFVELKKRNIDLNKLINAAVFEYKNTTVEKTVSALIYGTEFNNSVSRLETFAACAYKHFIQYGLQLVPRKTFEIESKDIGTMYHSAIEKFSKKISELNLKWRDISDSERNEIINKCVDEVAIENADKAVNDNSRNEYVLERIRKMSEKTAWALQEQLKAGKFEPGEFEFKFSPTGLSELNYEFDDGTKMGIKGVIDRIDYYNDGDDIYIKIIDYKSGSKKFEINDVYNGLQLQLVLYMEAAMADAKRKFPSKNIIPAGIFYYNIDNPVIDITDLALETAITEEDKQRIIDETVAGESLKYLKVNGVVNDSQFVIESLDEALKGGCGNSRVIPVSYVKSGGFGKNSSQMTEGEFRKLIEFVHKKSAEIGQNIIDGNVDVSPYIKAKKNGNTGGGINPCTYCDYSNICGFDKKIRGYDYRPLFSMKKEDVLANMKCYLGEEDKKDE